MAPRRFRAALHVVLASLTVFALTVIVSGPSDQPFERTSVTVPDTLSQRSVRVFALGDDGSGVQCSGFLVGPALVMTAAHCVRNRSSFLLQPAAHEGPAAPLPFGQCTAGRPGYHSANTTGDSVDPLDYALLHVEACDVTGENPSGSPRIGDLLGWWDLYPASDDELRSTSLVHLGYPGTDPSGKLWRLEGDAVLVACGPVLSRVPFLCPHHWQVVLSGTAPQGTSGGVLYADLGDGPVAVGVQNGYDETSNRAVFHRVDQSVLADVAKWS